MTDKIPRTEKTPAEEEKFVMDFSDRLVRGESISSITSTSVTPAGPSIDWTAIDGSELHLFMTGGTAETEYEVRGLVLIGPSGRTLEGIGILNVVTR